ncbi:hypothetical protein, partial [Aeromonas hydrophila]|uniref:hypothetical protein n=1 Tax=Aeromonas hydrophila TaxID=644 RepID=UPI0036DE5FCD
PAFISISLAPELENRTQLTLYHPWSNNGIWAICIEYMHHFRTVFVPSENMKNEKELNQNHN